jgi:hypothetical protein
VGGSGFGWCTLPWGEQKSGLVGPPEAGCQSPRPGTPQPRAPVRGESPGAHPHEALLREVTGRKGERERGLRAEAHMRERNLGGVPLESPRNTENARHLATTSPTLDVKLGQLAGRHCEAVDAGIGGRSQRCWDLGSHGWSDWGGEREVAGGGGHTVTDPARLGVLPKLSTVHTPCPHAPSPNPPPMHGQDA